VNLGNGSLSGSTGDALFATGANGSINYSGTIASGTAHSVNITNMSGGTVTLTGAITDTSAGISLTSNGGATVNFQGGINVNVTGGAGGFVATGGGTINVCDESPCSPTTTGALVNTLTTATGTALNVTNTTIGGGNLEFRKISAGTGSAGPVNGILLNNTGGSGGLRIKGSGGSCSTAATCTGGAIQDTSGAGISLTNTQKVSIDRLFIQDTAKSGVSGTQVVDFAFTNGRVDNSGTSYPANPKDDSNIGFGFDTSPTANNLSGVVIIAGNTLTNAAQHGVDIQNFDGTISDADISNNSITSSTSAASSHGSGIRLLGFGSNSTVSGITKATIVGNTVMNFPGGAGIISQVGNNTTGPVGSWGTVGSSEDRIFIQNNVVQGQSSSTPMNSNAILMTLIGSGQANWLADSNGTLAQPITNIGGTEIGVTVRGANPTVTCDITNNRIVGITSVNAQAIAFAADSQSAPTDAPQLSGTISGNIISGQDGEGIQALAAPGSTAHVDVSIKNNVTTAPSCGGCNRFGITAQVGSSSGNTTGAPSMCLDMSGNTAAGSGVNTGIGIRKKTAAYVFNIEGFAGGGNPTAFLTTLNPTGGGVTMMSQSSGFGNCATAPTLGGAIARSLGDGITILSTAFYPPSIEFGTSPHQPGGECAVNSRIRTAETGARTSLNPVYVNTNGKVSSFDERSIARVSLRPGLGGNVSVAGSADQAGSGVFAEIASKLLSEISPVARAAGLENDTAAHPSVPYSGELITVNNGGGGFNLPAGKSVTVAFSAQIAAGFTGTSVSNQANVTAAGGINVNSNTTNTDVYRSVAISKAFSPTSIAPGGSSTVTLTLVNSNPSAQTNGSFTDMLANMSAVGGAVGGSCVGTTPSSLAAGATALSFSGITIPGNGSCTVTFSVTSSTPGVNPNSTSAVATTQAPTGGSASNTATLSVVDANIQLSPLSATNEVNTNHVLTITVNASGGTLAAGTASASIVSGPGSFVGSNSCAYAGGGASSSCTVTITSAALGTTVVSATSDITVSGSTISRTTDTAANTAAGGSGNATKTWQDARISTTATIRSDGPDPSHVGQKYTIVVGVKAVSQGPGNPTGTVVVSDGAGATCTITLANPTCQMTSTVAGMKTLTANYLGDTNYRPSSGTAQHNVLPPE